MRYKLHENFFPCEEIDRNMIFIGHGLSLFTVIAGILQTVISVYAATAVIEKMSFHVVLLSFSPQNTHSDTHTGTSERGVQ